MSQEVRWAGIQDLFTTEPAPGQMSPPVTEYKDVYKELKITA